MIGKTAIILAALACIVSAATPTYTPSRTPTPTYASSRTPTPTPNCAQYYSCSSCTSSGSGDCYWCKTSRVCALYGAGFSCPSRSRAYYTSRCDGYSSSSKSSAAVTGATIGIRVAIAIGVAASVFIIIKRYKRYRQQQMMLAGVGQPGGPMPQTFIVAGQPGAPITAIATPAQAMAYPMANTYAAGPIAGTNNYGQGNYYSSGSYGPTSAIEMQATNNGPIIRN